MAPTYLRQDQASITVDLTLPNGQNLANAVVVKSWATLEGGDLESEDTKTRPGGMVDQVNLGGPTTRTDATVSRPYTREIHPYLTQMEQVAGRGKMTVKFTILDGSGTAFRPGTTIALDGILKNVTRPNWDSNATGAAMLMLVMGCNVAAKQAN